MFTYDEGTENFAPFKIVDITDSKILDLIILNYCKYGPFKKRNNNYYFDIPLKRMKYENITDDIEQIYNLNNEDSRREMFLKLIKSDTYYICNLECLYASNGKIVSELFKVNFLFFRN